MRIMVSRCMIINNQVYFKRQIQNKMNLPFTFRKNRSFITKQMISSKNQRYSLLTDKISDGKYNFYAATINSIQAALRSIEE